MEVFDLNNRKYKWKLHGYTVGCKHRDKVSNLHKQARQLLQEVYPAHNILEEVPIPITKSQKLYLDFYIPILKLAIEVHGQQHYEYSKFYHKSQLNFIQQLKNDVKKQQWCDKNHIELLILPYNENINEWQNKFTS